MTHLRLIPSPSDKPGMGNHPSSPTTPPFNPRQVQYLTRVWWGQGQSPQHALLAEGVTGSLTAAAEYAKATHSAALSMTSGTDGWVWVEAIPSTRSIADQWKPVGETQRALFTDTDVLLPWSSAPMLPRGGGLR